MSKLEVDKITPQSGTTLTIGDSGDTIVIDSTSVSGAKLAAPTLVGSASSAGSILFKEDTDNGTNAVTLIGPAATADVTLTLPAATDTVVGRQTTDTLTNKTINASQLVDASIATGKLADDAVTYAKMQDTSTANRVLGAASAGTISEVQIATDMIVDANVTTAKINDNAITLAKMASGTDGNIISYDASGNPVAIATGSDGQVLTSAGAGAQPAFETLPVGGITQADNWRINTSLSGLSYPGADITANWERADSTGQGSNMVIGNGISESSGVFTFPATGIYLISTYWEIGATNANDPYLQVQTLVTTNNSSYGIVSRNGQGLTKYDSSTFITGSMSNTVLIDVASTSNTKVKFYFRISGSHATLVGSNTEGKNGVCFVRLGDT